MIFFPLKLVLAQTVLISEFYTSLVSLALNCFEFWASFIKLMTLINKFYIVFWYIIFLENQDDPTYAMQTEFISLKVFVAHYVSPQLWQKSSSSADAIIKVLCRSGEPWVVHRKRVWEIRSRKISIFCRYQFPFLYGLNICSYYKHCKLCISRNDQPQQMYVFQSRKRTNEKTLSGYAAIVVVLHFKYFTFCTRAWIYLLRVDY